ncbi:hypothetical protein BGZ73_002377 [Actinomortierella ambigua]|nr:hypothetical protein BGZ73_002377 [Actinomortierella ambigua]
MTQANSTEASTIHSSKQDSVDTCRVRPFKSAARANDLVDDIWVSIFHLLAHDCKVLGRLLQVNRRFQRLIEGDSSLWRKSYNLTVASSAFGPSAQQTNGSSNYPWIRKESSRRSSYYSVSSCSASTCVSGGETCPSIISSLSIGRSDEQAEDQLVAEDHSSHPAALTSSAIPPTVQMPSPLVLPHHRRKAQSFSSSIDAGVNGRSGHSGQTVAATAAASAAAAATMTNSKHLHMSGCQHCRSTVLLHHSPAEYWKYQVVEWLDQEKLRQLRLGLFWGLSSDSSKNANFARRETR